MRRLKRDFPYYAGDPVPVSGAGWSVVAAACALGFVVLVSTPWLLTRLAPGFSGMSQGLAVAGFVLIPLIGLALASGRQWTALVAPPQWRDILVGLAFVPVVWVTSFAFASIILKTSATSANPALAMLASSGWPERAVFLASTAPQLFGEELVTVLPFLAILAMLHTRLNVPRRVAIVLAWLGSAILFGAMHLQTYDWHLVQALGGIGAIRLVLTLPYLITRSIWASTITHVLNDWSLFFVGIAIHDLGAGQ